MAIIRAGTKVQVCRRIELWITSQCTHNLWKNYEWAVINCIIQNCFSNADKLIIKMKHKYKCKLVLQQTRKLELFKYFISKCSNFKSSGFIPALTIIKVLTAEGLKSTVWLPSMACILWLHQTIQSFSSLWRTIHILPFLATKPCWSWISVLKTSNTSEN